MESEQLYNLVKSKEDAEWSFPIEEMSYFLYMYMLLALASVNWTMYNSSMFSILF